MAQVTLATVLNALASRFKSQLSNQINRASVLAQVLPVGAGTGKNIQWVARTGSALGSSIADGADVTVFNNDDKRPAVLQYGVYHDAFSITGKALAGARAAGNPEELASLFLDELGDSVERLASRLNIDFWSGDGTGENMFGLLAAAGGLQDSGVYAGIDRAAVAQWQGNVLDNAGTGRALTFDVMREMRRTIYEASGEKPDLIVCSPALHEKYGRLFGAERRYVDQIRMRGNTIRLDGGYQVLEFDGIPVIEDKDCPTESATQHQMVFLNSRHVEIMQLADQSDRVNNGLSMARLGGTPEEHMGSGEFGLQARVQPLAITGDAYKFALYVYPQVCVKRPNACGVIKDLDPAL